MESQPRSPLYSLSAFKAAFAVTQLLPRPVTRPVADVLATWSLRRAPELRSIMRENLSAATGLEGGALDGLIRENVRNFCRMLADYFACAGRPERKAPPLLGEFGGWEHIEAARSRGNGMILVTGHIGHWELGGLSLALRGVPVTVVTLPEPTSALTRWRGEWRRRLGIGTIEVGPGRDFALVEMLSVLRANGCLAMLVDRPYSGSASEVRQFGRTTHYSTGPALLAHHSGAPVIPAFVLQRPDFRYRAFACPPVSMTGGALRENLPQNVQRIADVFEVLIREHPGQWFNYVRVFSTR